MSIEQSTVGLEGIQFAGAVVIDRLADVGDTCSELCAMEVGKHCTGRSSLRLAGLGKGGCQDRDEKGRPQRKKVWRADLPLLRERTGGGRVR